MRMIGALGSADRMSDVAAGNVVIGEIPSDRSKQARKEAEAEAEVLQCCNPGQTESVEEDEPGAHPLERERAKKESAKRSH